MKFERRSGILLHPSSLPGPYGIGELGAQALAWIDFLFSSGCTLWQVLPLGPTGYGDSPYQCFSAYAGNPYLISLEGLLAEQILLPEDLAALPDFPAEKVDFGWLIPWKLSLLEKAFNRFRFNPPAQYDTAIMAFRQNNAYWLDDFSLFMALKDAHGGSPWTTWETALRERHPQAMEQAREDHHLSIERHVFQQFLFFSQWQKVKEYAHRKGIQIIGDVPIFIAHDSADAWSSQELFHLDNSGAPLLVAGVPPDYFSPTGQLWGNPLYKWELHQQTGFEWWIKRIQAALAMVDLIRLDHFRGFAAYWEIPGNAKTAEKGQWVKAPGKDFLTALQSALGRLPIIAEDLGVITPDVEDLRDSFNLPGMKIVQFGFGGNPQDPFLLHNHAVNCVVYTGTHDNDTVLGWYERVGEPEREFYRRYLDRDGNFVGADMIRAAWMSVAKFALAPMQDFLNLGNDARMNYPGNPNGNWTWRMPPGCLSAALIDRIRELNYLYARTPAQPAEDSISL